MGAFHQWKVSNLEVTFRGLDLGDTDRYIIDMIDGWDSLPDLMDGSVANPRRHGMREGDLLAAKRVVTISMSVEPDPSDNWLTNRNRLDLMKAMAPTRELHTLYVALGEGLPPEQIEARVTAREIPLLQGYNRRQSAVIEFTAPDPRRYSAALHGASTSPRRDSPGMVLPIVLPATLTPTPGYTGDVLVTNSGNIETLPVYTIRGPIPRPSIMVTDQQGRRRVEFDITLAAGEYLRIYPRNGMVMLNDQVMRDDVARGALVYDLFLRPGDSLISFGGTSSGASLDVEWRDATI